MATTQRETGHYKNVANFKGLTLFCQSLGKAYKPSRTDITLPGLKEYCNAASAIMDEMNAAEAVLAKAVAGRAAAFLATRKLATRLCNALEATNPSSPSVKASKHYLAKIRGKRIGTPAAVAENTEGTTTTKTRSVSQTSYDALIDHFNQLVTIVSTEPAYAPNETNLTITALQQHLAKLVALNTAAVNAYSELKLLAAQRNKVLYAPVTGLTSVADSIKKYIKAVYGASSLEMKAAHGFPFRRFN